MVWTQRFSVNSGGGFYRYVMNYSTSYGVRSTLLVDQPWDDRRLIDKTPISAPLHPTARTADARRESSRSFIFLRPIRVAMRAPAQSRAGLFLTRDAARD